MRLNHLLPAALLAFGIAAFALPGEAAYGFAFYACVMPALALGWRCIPSFGRGDAFALALIAWSGVTLLWGEGPPHRILQFGIGVAATGAFFIAIRRMLAVPEIRHRFAAFLICAGAANAGLVLLVRAPSLLAGDRILGWGITRQPILGGSVMSVCFLTALAWWLKSPRALKSPLPPLWGREGFGFGFYACAACVMAFFILAMQSRGALFGATGGAILIIASSPWRWRALATLASLAGLMFLARSSWRAQAEKLLIERGTSHRLEIWARTLELIRQKPLFGHGLAANVPPYPTGFPHSLYLSLLFYSGAVGLLLFAALVACVARRLWRHPASPERAWVAALWLNGLLAGITDIGQITKGPGPLWMILWVPAALSLSLSAHDTRSKPAPSRASHSVAARRWGESDSASAQNAAP